MASAIELYKQAYEADYNRGDPLYAEEVYRRIVEEFPHSDEKEYALIHLERLAKLKGNPDDPLYQPVRNRSSAGALGILNFVLILLLLAGQGLLGYYLWQDRARWSYNELILEGLAAERAGDFTGSYPLYKLAQQTQPSNPLAYRCMAELYLGQGRLEQAATEGKAWASFSPNDPGIEGFKARLTKALEAQGGRP